MSDPETVPPGLIPGKAVHVVALPRSAGKAVSYVGTGNAVVCGVAIYGRVSTRLKRALVRTIEGGAPEMQRSSPDFYHVSDAKAKKVYWGRPQGPGITGILMVVRRPGTEAPTIEVQYHNILM